MIVPECDCDHYDPDLRVWTGDTFSGGMSSGWCEPLDDGRRRIGFMHVAETGEPVPIDPSWMLLP